MREKVKREKSREFELKSVGEKTEGESEGERQAERGGKER